VIDLSQAVLCEWLGRVVDHLTENRGFDLSALMLAKYVLFGKLQEKINTARMTAKGQSFQHFFLAPESRVMLDFDNGFEFKERMYDDVLHWYQGSYKFTKHFLGSQKVPAFDGDQKDGEEILCAMVIDQLPDVEFWIRNVERHRCSYWMQSSPNNFYPDFVALLKNGNTLVVEYKGQHLLNDPATKNKRLIGELYAHHADGRLHFVMPSIPKGTSGNARWDCIEREIVRAITDGK